MGKEIAEHIYLGQDIERASNWGLETCLAVFEKSLGLSFDNRKLVLGKVKTLQPEIKPWQPWILINL